MGRKDTSLTILIVDDEAEIAEIARDEFEEAGWQAKVVAGVTEAKDMLKSQVFDAVLSDVAMVGATGIELLTWVRQTLGDRLVFFLLTGGDDIGAREATKFGANAIFKKPCDWPRLINAVSIAVTLQNSRKL